MKSREPSSHLPAFDMPVYAAGASEQLLTGGRLWRQAFAQGMTCTAKRDAVIIAADETAPPALLINRGVAYSSGTVPDGRRAILDILLPGDIVGIEHAMMGRANQEIVAASPLTYHVLPAVTIRELMADPAVALRALALMGEALWRANRHAMALARFDARGRIAAFLLGIHDRLRQRELINRATFNLPLTQEQVADHLGLTMVHVSRTLRRMREQRLVLVDRQVVIIQDMSRLRELATGLSPMASADVPTAWGDGAATAAELPS